MLLDLKKLFAEETGKLPFKGEMDLSGLELSGAYPFSAPVSFEGSVTAHNSFLQLHAELRYRLTVPCDRCAEQIDQKQGLDVDHSLVSSLHNEGDNDTYLVVENDTLDLEALLREDLLLSLPSKFLCREDCRGLCSVCGKNLNEGPCGCGVRPVDPRLEVLKDLLN